MKNLSDKKYLINGIMRHLVKGSVIKNIEPIPGKRKYDRHKIRVTYSVNDRIFTTVLPLIGHHGIESIYKDYVESRQLCN